MLNLSHLDHLGEEVSHNGEAIRIVHIYAEAPDYDTLADPHEGTACVDDAVRAAVVYLRHFAVTGDAGSKRKGESLLRFILYMQSPQGLFYNFVLNHRLEINRTHHRSRADRMEWWTARAIWALGTGVEQLKNSNPELAKRCAEAVCRCLPHIEELLRRYPQTRDYRGRTIPTWLIHEDASDATSEMLLGLAAFNRAQPSADLQAMINRFAEGIALMRYGSMSTFPYGCHASWRDGWHLWGNSQTQALAEAGVITSAKLEAEQFYPRLLVEGFLHSITFDDLHALRYFERIAYGIRAVAVGLLRLFEATGDTRFAAMAGLAASWFTGNNAAGVPVYDPATGRGYDGLVDEARLNRNAGAESTIEALSTILEIEQVPAARRWLHARGSEPVRMEKNGMDYFYRVFRVADASSTQRVALIMNLTQETFELIENDKMNEKGTR